MSRLERLLAAVDAGWIASQTEQLVRIPSVTMEEEEVCRYYDAQLRSLGLDVDVREITPGRTNLYACVKGSGGGPALMLNGHLDTIPNQTRQPVRREGDLIFGRGTTDMKGGMAAMLGAVRALQAADIQLQGDLWLTAVVGHEEPEAEKDGPLALIADRNAGRIGGDRIIIVEGPDALWVMSMGSMLFTVNFRSDRGGLHTQYVPFSENPIRYLGEAIQAILRYQARLDAGSVHPLAGAERIDLGIAASGDYFNRTPNDIRLVGTRRWSPGKAAGDVLEELRNELEPIARAGHLQLALTMEHEREPFETAADDAIVRAVAQAHRQVTGQDADMVGKRIVGDGNLYVHGTGIPTIYYGPSNETAHADIENVSIERLKSAASVYALAAVDYCGAE